MLIYLFYGVLCILLNGLLPNFYDRAVANKGGGSMEATATRTLDSVQTLIMKGTKLTNKETQVVGRELTATGPVS